MPVRSSRLLTAPQPTRHIVCSERGCTCVLTTIYCKYSMAAGACPTESMEVAEHKSQHTHGVPKSPDAELKTSVDYNTRMASKTTNEPQTNVARHPTIPISIVIHPDPLLFNPFIPRPLIWHRGPRPEAHWYICTD